MVRHYKLGIKFLKICVFLQAEREIRSISEVCKKIKFASTSYVNYVIYLLAKNNYIELSSTTSKKEKQIIVDKKIGVFCVPNIYTIENEYTKLLK